MHGDLWSQKLPIFCEASLSAALQHYCPAKLSPGPDISNCPAVTAVPGAMSRDDWETRERIVRQLGTGFNSPRDRESRLKSRQADTFDTCLYFRRHYQLSARSFLTQPDS